MRLSGIFILVFLPFLASAQFHFREKTDIQVYSNSNQMKMPFAGGINSAQFQKMDLNNDKVEDLVIFDRTSNSISVFLALNSSYTYSPDYSALFPNDITNWMELRDFDCDGDKDIFTSAIFGMRVYENLGFTGNLLNWTLAQDPIYTVGFSGLVNLQMNGTDLPAIEDLDGDGDLDILVFDFAGSGGIEFHENQGGCGTFDYARITKSWGQFKECLCEVYDFGNGCTDVSLNRTSHVAPKSILVRDFNNDGHSDLLVGQAGCELIDLLENKGDNINAVFDSFYKGFPLDNPVLLQYFPAPFMEDVDFDGIDDLLISSNSNPAIDGPMDFSSTSYFFKNTGTNNFPLFELADDHFLQGEMIDAGQGAHTAFLDMDLDGDMDMLVGSDGNGHVDGYYSTLYYYENTGTSSLPIFQLLDEDFADISSLRITRLIPFLADLNEDGKSDLVFSGTDASFTAKLYYIPNTSPIYGTYEFKPADLSQSNLPVSPGDTPGFFYYDNDSKPDLLLGKVNGALDLYQNTGSGNFLLLQNDFMGLTGTTAARYLCPAVGDLNGDGKPDLITNDSKGEIKLYSDFLTSELLPEPQSPWLENSLLGSFIPARFGINATITIADITGTSSADIIVGSLKGGIHILENLSDREDASVPLEVHVFPIPVVRNNFSRINIIANLDCTLHVITIGGSQIMKPLQLRDNVLTQLDVSHFTQGLYLLHFISSRERKTIRIAILE